MSVSAHLRMLRDRGTTQARTCPFRRCLESLFRSNSPAGISNAAFRKRNHGRLPRRCTACGGQKQRFSRNLSDRARDCPSTSSARLHVVVIVSEDIP